jgi:type II secretory pathway predicted ATPase ExeA
LRGSASGQSAPIAADGAARRRNLKNAAVAEAGLAHLHPGIRAIALADDAVRLQAMRAKRWITHDPASRVLATLQEAFDQPAGDRMGNLLLIGESGMGKTMVLRKFQRDQAPRFDPVRGVQPHPVVLTLMAEDPSVEAFFCQILKAVGAPVAPLQRRHGLSLRETTFRLLRELGTRMLMIDEINSILVGSARQQRQFLQLLRFLSNELQVAIVCAGVPEARFALLSDPQLRSRVAEVALEPWTVGPALQDFINKLVQSLPLRQPSPVDSLALRRLLVARSGGITLSICQAIERAGVLAIRHGRERIDLASLDSEAIWRGIRPAPDGTGQLRPAALARQRL